MCGIFGQLTNNPKRINDGNIKILGIANIERGRNSCGITIDGEIKYGLDKLKLFSDFSKGQRFKATKYPVVIAHTRQSSVGIVNEANAHPFGFGENSLGEPRMIGVHNGTLYNHEELALEHNVALTESFMNPFGYQQQRTKIDSEILLEIIYRTKSLKVLSQYNGGAALVWTDTEEPNVAYLYSGASKEYASSPDMVIERPLFVYIESNTNMYYSSLAEPLEVIGGTLGQDVFQIENNVVFKIKNGNFAKAEKFSVSRLRSTGKKSYTQTTANFNHSRSNNSNNVPSTTTVTTKPVINLNATTDTPKSGNINIRNLSPVFDILSDFDGRIYERNLRYYRNGSPITGIYVFVPTYGLVSLNTVVPHVAKASVAQLTFQIFNKKSGHFTGQYHTENGKPLLPDEVVLYNSEKELPKIMFILEGVRIQTELDFTATFNQPRFMKNRTDYDYAKLSHISVGPVIDIHSPMSNVTSADALRKGLPATGSFTDLCFTRSYTFISGTCTSLLRFEVSGLKFLEGLPGYVKYMEKMKDKVIELPTEKPQSKNIANMYGVGDLAGATYSYEEVKICSEILTECAKNAKEFIGTIDKQNRIKAEKLKADDAEMMELMALEDLQRKQAEEDYNNKVEQINEEVNSLSLDGMADCVMILKNIKEELESYNTELATTRRKEFGDIIAILENVFES